ncbi:hypothetical protein GGI25_004483 [Coemansia spiralis]|uniref:BZIP domain-containing protein n=2 Tax=Coemansia TaxID=4863 RepID=A0A9W8G6I5_9FUNG|nr:hypothetical protein BX070DRAFT_236902 [Coemansia spiralis]KAJ1988522.1 hypothetical protein EDC05_005241 [Coemansia umbellata]KAJ2619833.1 hypothetical protein GGI26_005507 [Coemansia sp. RSA 1358]KAJ2673998.1 hypothetical protein GGI25_004483 [Coemansia spiralis]
MTAQPNAPGSSSTTNYRTPATSDESIATTSTLDSTALSNTKDPSSYFAPASVPAPAPGTNALVLKKDAEEDTGYVDDIDDDTVMSPKDNSTPADAQPSDNMRAPSPRSARRIRNRLAAARMRTRQKQHLAELEQRKANLERRAADLEEELHSLQSKNNPLSSSIDELADMIDNLTKVEYTMLSGINECRSLLESLEKLFEERNGGGGSN